MLNGILNIYKEPGYTSHDVVAKMRGICGQRKIGHTGTLDPDAVGVLPVCLGNGTRLCDMLTEKDKEYETRLLLGVVTDTQDLSGQILNKLPVTCTEAEAEEAISGFIGEYLQVPPMYSALKVNGRKLYELARAGKEVERNPRPVTIHRIEILKMELPHVWLRVNCSKGTYIRTLCADIGDKLGCGGTMAELKRTRVGNFCITEAITLAELEQLRDQGKIEDRLYKTDSVFADYPMLHILPEYKKLLQNGNAVYPDQTAEKCRYPAGKWVRFYDEEQLFYGIFTYDDTRCVYKLVKMFLTNTEEA